MWQTQIQTIENGLNGAKRIKKKQVIMILCTLWYEFLNDFDAQSDFGKKNSQKICQNHFAHQNYLKFIAEGVNE